MRELDRIAQLQQALNSLQPLQQEHQRKLDEKFRLEFNYNSNHLEGNTLTYSETKLLLIFEGTNGNHTARELDEMRGSDVAFKMIQELASEKERPLTEQFIKDLNEVLLVRPFWKDAITPDGQPTRRQIKVGEYKEFPNSVRLENGEMFDYASPIDTPILMSELIEWYRKEEESKELNPVVLAALLHYKYVCIHPFDDGNGRISRLLMNYVLFKNNLPPIVIKSDDKRNYLMALNRADSGDLESFTKYIAEQLVWSLEISIKAAKGESIDEPGDLDKKINLLKKKLDVSNDEVKVTKSKEAIRKVVTNNLEPFFKALSIKLKQFDGLFKDKQESLFVEDGNLGEDLEESILYFNGLPSNKIPENILYKYRLSGLRKSITQKSFICILNLDFFQNVYELTSPNATFSINKLYDETLEEDEKQIIIEALGTYLYNEIEKVIRKE